MGCCRLEEFQLNSDIFCFNGDDDVEWRGEEKYFCNRL